MHRKLISAALAMCLSAAGWASPAQTSSEMAIGAVGHELRGTLLSPLPSRGRVPEPVLILAGSGPTDRDGNNPLGVRASTYRLLAEGLAARGIASLRVDKRGLGGSAGAGAPEESMRVGMMADDARSWGEALRQRTGARCVWLLGHSEGSLHALLAAQDNPHVCGLILVSAVGRRLGDILREQLRSNPANAPILDEALRDIAELEAGRRIDGASMHPVLMPLFRPSVQPYVMSMLASDPAALARTYRGPILVVQGTTDLQTAVADARALGAARPGVEVRILPGVNHVLKVAPADRALNVATYADPALPLAPGVADVIAQFIRRRH